MVVVTEVTDKEVIVDGNHPLAGQDLNFEVEILDIREATKDEVNLDKVHKYRPSLKVKEILQLEILAFFP